MDVITSEYIWEWLSVWVWCEFITEWLDKHVNRWPSGMVFEQARKWVPEQDDGSEVVSVCVGKEMSGFEVQVIWVLKKTGEYFVS